MPQIAIVVPIYNADIRCLKDCICSIKAQELSDFECILVDDCSPDRTCLDVARTITQGDPRFLYCENARHGGIASARNFGVASVAAPYVTFIDQDDVIHPKRLSIAVKALDRTGAEVCECAARRPKFKSNYSDIVKASYHDEAVLTEATLLQGREILDWYLHQKMNITVWSHVYRTGLLRDNPLPESVWGSDDLVYSLATSVRIDRLVKIRVPLYFWRLSPVSTTGRQPFAFIKGVCDAVDYVVRAFEQVDLTSAERENLSAYLGGAYIASLRDALQVDRSESEEDKIIELTHKVDTLVGGLVGHAQNSDGEWLSVLLHTDYSTAERMARKVHAELMRSKKVHQFKRVVKRLIGRK